MNIPNKMDDLGVSGVSPFQETSKWDVFVGKTWDLWEFMGLKRDIKIKNLIFGYV